MSQQSLFSADRPKPFRSMTVLQPCAQAMAARVKPWENRKGPAPSTIPVGSWLALAAGAAPWEDAAKVRRLWPECPADEDMPWMSVLGAWRFGGSFRRIDLFTMGGVAPLPPPRDRAGHPAFTVEGLRWAFGPWCWLVDEVRLFEAPIRCPGGQGVWFLPDEIAVEAWKLVA